MTGSAPQKTAREKDAATRMTITVVGDEKSRVEYPIDHRPHISSYQSAYLALKNSGDQAKLNHFKRLVSPAQFSTLEAMLERKQKIQQAFVTLMHETSSLVENKASALPEKVAHANEARMHQLVIRQFEKLMVNPSRYKTNKFLTQLENEFRCCERQLLFNLPPALGNDKAKAAQLKSQLTLVATFFIKELDIAHLLILCPTLHDLENFCIVFPTLKTVLLRQIQQHAKLTRYYCIQGLGGNSYKVEIARLPEFCKTYPELAEQAMKWTAEHHEIAFSNHDLDNSDRLKSFVTLRENSLDQYITTLLKNRVFVQRQFTIPYQLPKLDIARLKKFLGDYPEHLSHLRMALKKYGCYSEAFESCCIPRVKIAHPLPMLSAIRLFKTFLSMSPTLAPLVEDTKSSLKLK